MVANNNSASAVAAATQKNVVAPELMPNVGKGHAKRTPRIRNSWTTAGTATSSSMARGNKVPGYVGKSASSGESSADSRIDRYEMPARKSSSSTQQTRNTHSSRTANGTANRRAEGPPSIPSLLSTDGSTSNSVDFDLDEQQIMETDLYQKFEDAFNITMRNNPGILPGAPSVIESIKGALYKVKKSKAQKETAMRKQLEKIKIERDQMEAQLRKEMGTTAMRKNELAKELEASTNDRDVLQESLIKQREAIEAVKRELKLKMSEATAEKEELTNNLRYLSKSRAELEKALEAEMQLVEKDRNALQNVVAERKKLQRQKAENKQLEGKIERMTQAASREKKALQAEVADLNKFEEHMRQLRKQNEETRKSLDNEKLQLKELADTMQTKKITLRESKSELETQYQKEIEELEGKIRETKMVHEKDMEAIVKNRVLGYLQKTGDGSPIPAMDSIGMKGSADSKNVEELQARLNELQQKRMSMAEIRKNGDKDELIMREIDGMREEIEIAKARNSRRSTPGMGRHSHGSWSDGSGDIREEIRSLREELSMGLRTPHGQRRPNPAYTHMGHSRPSPYLDELEDDIEQRDEIMRPQTQRAGRRPRYFYESREDDDNDIRLSPPPPQTTRSHFRSPPPSYHQRPRGGYHDGYDYDAIDRMHLATPPLRSARQLPRMRARSSGRTRYY